MSEIEIGPFRLDTNLVPNEPIDWAQVWFVDATGEQVCCAAPIFRYFSVSPMSKIYLCMSTKDWAWETIEAKCEGDIVSEYLERAFSEAGWQRGDTIYWWIETADDPAHA